MVDKKNKPKTTKNLNGRAMLSIIAIRCLVCFAVVLLVLLGVLLGDWTVR